MLLCSKANETYAIINGNFGEIMSIKGVEIVGKLGQLFDKILAKKHLRKCKLIGRGILGEKMPNGTYTGNLGLLQSREAIIYLKVEPPLVDESWIHYNIPFYSEKFLVRMDISEDNNHETINDMINNLNFGFAFTVTFILTIFGCFFISNLIKALVWKQKDNIFKKFKHILSKKSILNKWNTTKSSSTALRLFLVFFNFYIWLVTLNILNNIKTNKVIVDTSSLIKNKEDAFKTKRVCCFFEGNTELAIAKTAPRENVLRRLYEDKSWIKEPIENSMERDRCIFEMTLASSNYDPKILFTILSESGSYIFSGIVGSSKSGFTMWIPSKPIYESNCHMIMRNEKDIVDSFYWILLAYTEAGIPEQLKKSFIQSAIPFYMANKIYRTLEEFKDDNSKCDILVIENFAILFLTYFTFCLIIFLISVFCQLLTRL